MLLKNQYRTIEILKTPYATMMNDCTKSFSIRSYNCIAGNTAATMRIITTTNSIIMLLPPFFVWLRSTFCENEEEGAAWFVADLQEKHRHSPCLTGNAVEKRVKPNDLGGVGKRCMLPYCPLAYLALPIFFAFSPPFSSYEQKVQSRDTKKGGQR